MCVPLWRCETSDWLDLATVKTEKLTLFPQQSHSLIIFFSCVYSSSWNTQVETCLKHRAMLRHAIQKKKKMTSGAFDKQILAASQNNSHRETAKCMTIWYAVLFKAVFFLTKVIAEWQNKLLKQTEVRRVVCFKTLFYMYIYFAFCMRSQETQKSSQILTLSHEKKH